MPEKEIISLDQAQMAAERFLEGQFKNHEKTRRGQSETGFHRKLILIYDVDGNCDDRRRINQQRHRTSRLKSRSRQSTAQSSATTGRELANKTTQDSK